AAVRRLAPVLLRGRRGDALPDDLVGVPADRLHPAQLDERAVAPVAEAEARAEVVRADPVEAGVDAGGVDGVAHRPTDGSGAAVDAPGIQLGDLAGLPGVSACPLSRPECAIRAWSRR